VADVSATTNRQDKTGWVGDTDRRQLSGENQLHQVQDESNEDDEKARVKFEWRTHPPLCFTSQNSIIMHQEVSKISIRR
jgi:aminoglycoside/choline kinase family phosphotransferase